MKALRYIIIFIFFDFAICANAQYGSQNGSTSVDSISATAGNSRAPIVRKSTINGPSHIESKKVRIGNDTVPLVIPQKNYGRFDRGLYNYLYLPKGDWAFGITASYGSLSTEDVQILSMLQNIDFEGKMYSIKPSVAYTFANNQSLGIRLNYTNGSADLANLGVDVDEDINFQLHNVSYYSHSYDFGIFYRYYVGLNDQKRFAVFNEATLNFTNGYSRFKRYYDDKLYDTHTTTTGLSLNFSPGVCIFIHEYVAFNVSFGVFGLKLTKENQDTNGINDGSRFSSGANFKFNIFNINFGMMVVI